MRLPLVLPLKPSPSLLVALAVAHGVAFLSALVAAWPLAMKALVALVLALSGWWTLGRQLRPHQGKQPMALGLRADGAIELHYPHGEAQLATVHISTTLFPWLITLRLTTDARRLSLCLPRDALGPEGHRQLRLWLAWLARTE